VGVTDSSSYVELVFVFGTGLDLAHIILASWEGLLEGKVGLHLQSLHVLSGHEHFDTVGLLLNEQVDLLL